MNPEIRKKVSKISLIFLGVMVLLAGIALPAYAEVTSSPNTTHIVQGQVQSISGANLVVLTANQQQVPITTNNNTQYYIIPMGKVQGYVNNRIATDNKEDKREGDPKQTKAAQLKELHIPANWRSDLGWLEIFDNKSSLSDITAGDRVIVRADSVSLAKQVLIIKAPVNRTVKGSITLTNPNDPTRITITPSGAGNGVILKVVGTTRIILKGQTSISGYAVALYNSTNTNALIVNIQATEPTPESSTTKSPSGNLK